MKYRIDRKLMTIPEIRRATGLDHREIARRLARGATTMRELSNPIRSKSFDAWTTANHKAAATLPPRQAAVKLGRSLNAVYLYRSAARIARRPHET